MGKLVMVEVMEMVGKLNNSDWRNENYCGVVLSLTSETSTSGAVWPGGLRWIICFVSF